MQYIWPILRNLSTVVAFIKAVREILIAVGDKKVPEEGLIQSLFDAVIKLLRAKVIDVPNLDEEQLADELQKIKDKIFPPVK